MQNSAEKLDKLRKLNHLLAEQDTELATEAADLRSTESNLEVARAPDSVDVSIDLESITHRRLRPVLSISCLLYTSPSPRDATLSRMPSSA